MQLGMNATCTLCPRSCGVNRRSAIGFCGASDELEVASVCLHRGEEPPLNPIVNVFFAHCNLQCIYCQNWQISGLGSISGCSDIAHTTSINSIADRIADQLPQSGGMLGLVTAAHYADRLPELLDAVRSRLANRQLPHSNLTVVYNSSGYERAEVLRALEGLVDIYLPDFKYMDSSLAEAYSHAPDYPDVAQAALREMRRQVGTSLKIDDQGHAYRGLIVRHLVLPGAVDNSLQCLDWLADEFPFGLHLSLMSQYYPPKPDLPSPLNRTVRPDEYNTVVNHALQLGLVDGWIQQPDATDNYRPDFARTDNPFES